MEIHCLCRILIIRDCSAFERQGLEDHELDFPTFLTMIFTLQILNFKDGFLIRTNIEKKCIGLCWIELH